MKPPLLWHLMVALTLWLALPADAEIFKYVDNQGQTHYVDDRAKVPRIYRQQMEEKVYRTTKATPTPPPVATPSNVAPTYLAKTKKAASSLKRIIVPYKPYSRGARRILIPVTFNGTITSPMILDTGAPGLHISESLARKIGVFDGRMGVIETTVGGIGTPVKGYRTIIDRINIGDATDRFVPTTISAHGFKTFEGLVGMSLLDNYTMTVDSSTNRLIFDEIAATKERPGGHDRVWWKLNFYEFGQWRKKFAAEYRTKKREFDQINSNDARHKKLTAELKHARNQKEAANKIFRKLESYAAHSNVPMHWRVY